MSPTFPVPLGGRLLPAVKVTLAALALAGSCLGANAAAPGSAAGPAAKLGPAQSPAAQANASSATSASLGTASTCLLTAQTISFGALPARQLGDPDFTLAATASSGLPVTYISANSAVATVSGGYVRLRGAGTTTITALQDGNASYAPAVPVSQTLTVTPLLRVQYKDGDDKRPYGPDIKPTLRLENLGSAALPYRELTIRYWLTPENFSGLATSIDWAALGASHVHARYVPLPQPHRLAFGYVEYSFDASLGQLAAGGNSGEIRSRFHNIAYGDMDENIDYSYRYNSPSYVPNDRITAYRNGYLVWGNEPEVIDPVMALQAKTQNRNGSPRGNTISTYLSIENIGNVPVDYATLRARYWFSPDGSTNLNHWFDWAQVGTANVSGTVRQQGSELYFEVAFAPSLGQLYPLSSTGDVRFRLAKKDWTNFVEDNDWSYRPPWDYSENVHLTLYYQGQRIFGDEPPLATTWNLTAASLRGAGEAATGAASRLAAYPNPATSATTVQVEAAQTGQALVQVYGPLGQLVTTLYDGTVEDGRTYQLPLATQALANGLYECRLVLAGKTLQQRLVVSH